jgi:hypothetical protein
MKKHHFIYLLCMLVALAFIGDAATRYYKHIDPILMEGVFADTDTQSVIWEELPMLVGDSAQKFWDKHHDTLGVVFKDKYAWEADDEGVWIFPPDTTVTYLTTQNQRWKSGDTISIIRRHGEVNIAIAK